MRSDAGVKQAGFTLLEMLVAMMILAMSLGALYQGVGGAMRAVGNDEKYVYAVELARSLVAVNSLVDPNSIQQGETEGGFQWRVQSRSLRSGQANSLPEGKLQQLLVEVSWRDTGKTRRIALESVVAGRLDD